MRFCNLHRLVPTAKIKIVIAVVYESGGHCVFNRAGTKHPLVTVNIILLIIFTLMTGPGGGHGLQGFFRSLRAPLGHHA